MWKGGARDTVVVFGIRDWSMFEVLEYWDIEIKYTRANVAMTCSSFTNKNPVWNGEMWYTTVRFVFPSLDWYYSKRAHYWRNWARSARECFQIIQLPAFKTTTFTWTLKTHANFHMPPPLPDAFFMSHFSDDHGDFFEGRGGGRGEASHCSRPHWKKWPTCGCLKHRYEWTV